MVEKRNAERRSALAKNDLPELETHLTPHTNYLWNIYEKENRLNLVKFSAHYHLE